jgi:hypothetical protein
VKFIRGLPAVLLFLVPTITQANVAPVVDSLSASSTTVAPGGVVFLQVDGHDPDCPGTCDSSAGCGQYIRADLNHWTADGGTFENTDNGVSGSPFTSTTDWRAPATEGLYTITAYLPDNGGFLCGGRLTTTQDIQIQVTTNLNQPPVVSSVTANPTELYPGESSDLTCVASDPDDDPLTYEWSAYSGTITPGADGFAVFLADIPGAVTVTCTVTDTSAAPASDSVSLTVIGVQVEKRLERGLSQPLRLAVDSTGTVFVVDGRKGSVVALDLFSGTVLYRIPSASVTGLDVDWNGNLLVGLKYGAELWNRAGGRMLLLDGTSHDVMDVAVDHANRRYGILDRRSSKVTVYDEFGAVVVSFGANGDGPEQWRTPSGLATTPTGGYWADTHWVVADTGHGMVKIYDGSGNLASSFGATGGGVGEFVGLTGIAVGADDVIYGTDSFQSWVQAFEPDGTVRETLGAYGAGLGQFITPTGIAIAAEFDRLVATSSETGTLQVFSTTRNPVSQGPAPLAAIDPSLSFPATEVGIPSSPLSATLRNDGGAPFGITNVAVDGEFSYAGDCGDFVDPLQSCTFDVVFTPAAAGIQSGELRVETTAGAGPLVVTLSGTAVQSPTIELVPGTLYFPGQTAGTTSPTQDVTLTNLGPGTLSIGTIDATAPYQQAHNCPAQLGEGLSCTIAVQFTPPAVGSGFPGTLTVESGAIGSPHVVALDGQGVPVSIDVLDVTVTEGDTGPVDAVFEILLDGPSDGTFAVDYATADGTAVADLDYKSNSGTLAFATGEDRGTVTVTVLPDVVLEADEETFSLTLSNAVGAVIGDGVGEGEIVDNEVCAGPNLLRNGGAEDETTGAGILHWTEISGFDWHPLGGPTVPLEGARYFSAGAAPLAELEQMVDVGAFDDPILAGDQVFEFEGFVRASDEIPSDTARVLVEYLHRVSGAVLDSFDSGDVVDSSSWQRLHDVRTAPVDTGWIRVRLIATRFSGSDNEALFDGLTLRSHRAAIVMMQDNADYEGNSGTKFDMPFGVQLSCAYGEQVSLDFQTSPGTATPAIDYYDTGGRVEIVSGDTTVTIPVTVFGDDVDEAHETFQLSLLDYLPGDMVLQDPAGIGTIINDDFCPLKAHYWLKHPTEWPVYSLAIGGLQYDQNQLLELLDYNGGNVPSQVAREIAATKLNLAVGSPPDIVPTVVDADRFLTDFPPGTDPPRDALDWGQDLARDLGDYNKVGCP